MARPVNIDNALPTAAAPIPPNALERLPSPDPLPVSVSEALPNPDATPVTVLDALPGQDPDYHPVIILDALPIARTPPIQIILPVSDVSAAFGTGSTAGGIPNMWRTIADDDILTFVETDLSLAIASYIWRMAPALDPGTTSGLSVSFKTRLTGTTGLNSATFELTNFPGATFFSRTLNNAQLAQGGGWQDWTFALTVGEAAAIVTWATIRGSWDSSQLALPGPDPGFLELNTVRFLVPQP